MSSTQNNQSTETMKYTYYLGYNDVATTDRDVADFFEYCISRRANSKTEFKWNGETKSMLVDIENYCKKNNLSLSIEEVALGLHCYASEYWYDDEYDTITKNRFEHWGKIGKDWTDEFPYD